MSPVATPPAHFPPQRGRGHPPRSHADARITARQAISDDINLPAHAKECGIEVDNSVLQEVAEMVPSMTRLSLAGCSRINDVGLWALARNCTRLTGLDLSGVHQMTHVGLRSVSLRCAGLVEVSCNNVDNMNDTGVPPSPPPRPPTPAFPAGGLCTNT